MAAKFIILLTALAAALAPAHAFVRKQNAAISKSGQVLVCSGGLGREWSYRYNRLIVSPSETSYPAKVKEVRYLDPFHECKNKQTQKKRLIEGEYALTDKADMRVIGDLCAAEPTIVIHRLYANPKLTPENISALKNQRRSPYDFYVRSQTGLATGMRVEAMLKAYKLLAKQQCGQLPQTVRILGRTKFNDAYRIEGSAYRGKQKRNDYAFEQFYSGTYYPQSAEFRLVHDDEEQSILYRVLEGEFRNYLAKQYRYDPNRAALGLSVIASWALATQTKGGVAADPLCFDYTIPAAERAALGCPF
ncbi:hypothetical protein [Hyphococcus luteus]|uniref:Uncharacterized protein n=1 Tax=Hyphococcus luteus TaxID=2058213 RepID=A0A2S7K5F1_9PROT|nr:hypothetical protein [Marinicaulis flavus]PQA87722.1 hypothetical protein CW354_05005 [Marinicaulis flavus]